MTTANKVTILRILLVPFFVAQVLAHRHDGQDWHRVAALAAFGVAAALDGVDGFIARRFHQRSELGAVLDPLADKLLLAAGIILLCLNNEHLRPLPAWLVITLISRDLLVTLGIGVVQLTCGKVAVRTRWTGKVAVVLQMALVLWTLLKLPAAPRDWLAAVTAGFTLCSGVQYLFDGLHQLNQSPRSAATPGQ